MFFQSMTAWSLLPASQLHPFNSWGSSCPQRSIRSYLSRSSIVPQLRQSLSPQCNATWVIINRVRSGVSSRVCGVWFYSVLYKLDSRPFISGGMSEAMNLMQEIWGFWAWLDSLSVSSTCHGKYLCNVKREIQMQLNDDLTLHINNIYTSL